uniref:Putative longitudinals lacking protein isoform n=1 Tax=Xenopsylla cheopis TaxID=163159 RepID=A0A6M2DFE8_XENCH
MCPKCGLEFEERASFAHHVATKCGKLPNFKLPRNYPGNGFIGDDTMDFDDLNKNECSNCGRCYKSARYLARHEKYECENQPRMHKCGLCSYAAKRRSHLKSHTMRRHRHVTDLNALAYTNFS